MNPIMEERDSLPFANNTLLHPVSHVHIELREIHGIQLKHYITEWDINEFLKSEFSEPFYNVSIRYEEETTIDFFSSQPNVDSIVAKLHKRKTGINGKNINIGSWIVPPLPTQEEWESFFHCTFDHSPVGHRPDTVILSNLPVHWFQLENQSIIDASHPLFEFLQQFGPISEMQRMDASPLLASIGIVFNSYEGFCKCISTLRGHVLSKPNVKKEFLLDVAFDKTHYFSEENKQKRKEQERERIHQERKRLQKEAEDKEWMQWALKKIQNKQKAFQELWNTYAYLESPELNALYNEVKAREVDMKSHSSVKSYLSAVSSAKKEIKRIGKFTIQKQKEQQLHEINIHITELQHQLMEYVQKTEMISELDWMEDRRKRSESILQNVQKQSNEILLQTHDSILQSVQQAKVWMDQACEGQKCMQRMESRIEEIETPLHALKDSSWIEVIREWNKEIRENFMKINTCCVNQQQMNLFEQQFERQIQQYNEYVNACSLVMELQTDHLHFKTNTLKTIQSLTNRKYLMKQLDDSVDVTEQTWIMCDLDNQVMNMVEEIKTSLLHKEWDTKQVELLKHQLNCEKQVTDFILFIQEYTAFQERFCSVQLEAKSIADAIDSLKMQPSDSQDPLPDWSELSDSETKLVQEGLVRGNQLFINEWKDSQFPSNVQTFIKYMKGIMQSHEYLLKCKKEACKTTKKIIQQRKRAIEKYKLRMIDRYLYLQNRKQCIEQDLAILQLRKRLQQRKEKTCLMSEVSQVSNKSMSETARVCNKSANEHRIQFRYSKEKGEFEEILI